MKPRIIALLVFVPALISCLSAQDARVVVEPFFPPLCTTVDAQLNSSGGALAAEDEQKLDTARIQRAIDKCGKGRAVRLRVNEAKNAFLSGPLVLKPEVTLILDRGVTLFASRDAAVYARTPGSCGVVNETQDGCKPLISMEKANGAGIMGDGAINGRGDAKMLGSQYSWWDLAEQARKGGRQQAPRLIGADNSDRLTIYRITLKNPPAGAVYFDHGEGLTIWGVHIEIPQLGVKPISVGAGARNVTITRTETVTGVDSAAK